MHVILVGTSHRQAPVALRERLHIGAHEVGQVGAQLAQAGEAIVLATCNRTEIYLADRDPAAARGRLVAELALRGQLAEAELAPALYSANDGRAAKHLLRVAAGLDSLVVGEPQILGQVREAHRQAVASGAAGPLLDCLFRHALRAGKRVRAETALAERPASIAEAATLLARSVFGELTGRHVLLIGAGKMSEIGAASLVGDGVEKVFIASRTEAHAAALAAPFGGSGAAFDQLVAQLIRADIVVSSTACPRQVLSAAEVGRALRSRAGRPLLLIDIAVPRDLDPAIGGLPNCDLYDIDDLAHVVPDAAADACDGHARAEGIVLQEAARFEAWRRSRAVVPTISSLRRYAEAIRTAELARANGKLAALSSSERRAVETVTKQIVNRLLHEPTVRVKEAAATRGDGADSAALRHLFGLEEVS
jgi:glutamyl-tRNA reductase